LPPAAAARSRAPARRDAAARDASVWRRAARRIVVTKGSAGGEASPAWRCGATGQCADAQRCPAGIEKRHHRRRRRGQRGETFALAPVEESVPICRIAPDCLRRRSAGACGGFGAASASPTGGGSAVVVRRRCGHRVPSPALRPGRTLCRRISSLYVWGWDCLTFGGHAAVAIRGHVSFAGTNLCPNSEPSVPL